MTSDEWEDDYCYQVVEWNSYCDLNYLFVFWYDDDGDDGDDDDYDDNMTRCLQTDTISNYCC